MPDEPPDIVQVPVIAPAVVALPLVIAAVFVVPMIAVVILPVAILALPLTLIFVKTPDAAVTTLLAVKLFAVRLPVTVTEPNVAAPPLVVLVNANQAEAFASPSVGQTYNVFPPDPALMLNQS